MVTTRHPFKARCYTTLLQSLLLHGNIFYKILQSPNSNLTLFHKAQMLFWHLFYKTQILIWHYFIKPKYYFGTYFTKPKYYLDNYFIKPKCYFGTYSQDSNIILTLVLHILNLTLMGNIIIHPSRNTSLTRFVKAHEYHP